MCDDSLCTFWLGIKELTSNRQANRFLWQNVLNIQAKPIVKDLNHDLIVADMFCTVIFF